MNKAMLSHNYTRNQESSWNDDPFDLKGKFAGAASLSNEQKLQNFTEELVAHYAKYIGGQYELPLNSMAEFEQNELARLYLETTDRDMSECVYGNDFSINNEYSCAIVNLLGDDCQQNRDALSTIIMANIVSYYSDTLQKLINESCDNYLNNTMNENGYHAHRDLDSGDVVWGKF